MAGSGKRDWVVTVQVSRDKLGEVAAAQLANVIAAQAYAFCGLDYEIGTNVKIVELEAQRFDLTTDTRHWSDRGYVVHDLTGR